jgi:hypothetical protein
VIQAFIAWSTGLGDGIEHLWAVSGHMRRSSSRSERPPGRNADVCRAGVSVQNSPVERFALLALALGMLRKELPWMAMAVKLGR